MANILYIYNIQVHKKAAIFLIKIDIFCTIESYKLSGGMDFNATFNNISVILWRSVLLMEKIADKLYHIMLYRVYLA